jgi:alkylhydroperoxidase/carboxymuconolactone decarboxylase family protein YurZ
MTDSTDASSFESERDSDRQRALNAAQAVLREHGRTIRTAITGLTEGPPDAFMGLLEDAADEIGWGLIWARRGLEPRERAALGLAMTATKGQPESVCEHVRLCIQQAWEPMEIGEILLHVLIYTGLPTIRVAFKAAHEVFHELGVALPPYAKGSDGGAMALSEAVVLLEEAGLQRRREMFGDAFVDARIGQPDAFNNLFDRTTHAFALMIFDRAALGTRLRILLALAATAATGQFGGVALHVRSATANGITISEIGEVLLQAYAYGGALASAGAFAAAREALKSR